MDVEPAELPAGLGDLPPGPALASALSTVDRTRLTAAQLSIVVVPKAANSPTKTPGCWPTRSS
jgi:hypothetical protein